MRSLFFTSQHWIAGLIMIMTIPDNPGSQVQNLPYDHLPGKSFNETNPLLQKWTGPYGGVPPFDKVKIEHFIPALEAGMEEQLSEINKIASNPATPNFINTIEALENAGKTLNRVNRIYGIWGGNLNSKEFQAIQTQMAPKLSAFSDKITQNTALFKRIELCTIHRLQKS